MGSDDFISNPSKQFIKIPVSFESFGESSINILEKRLLGSRSGGGIDDLDIGEIPGIRTKPSLTGSGLTDPNPEAKVGK